MGYVYDDETQLYYLQSRYYNPEIGRFINADAFVSTGQGITGYNMFAYCGNNPVLYKDTTGTRYEISAGGGGGNIELGNGWYYRIEPAKTTTRTKRHIHVWNKKNEYIQNDDGSPHDKRRGEKGKIPKWLNNKLIEKAGWDYNGNRKFFFEGTSCIYYEEGIQYSFPDGTIISRSYNPYLQTWYSIDSYEGVYFRGDITSPSNSHTTHTFYLPIIGPIALPSFSFTFGGGFLPTPLFC